VVTTRAFGRDAKRIRKRGLDMARLRAVVEALRLGHPLEARHRDHALASEWAGFRDCHVAPDRLLIYAIDDEAVTLVRTGTHSDIFG
jgi:mRNA interferase YafQ